MNPHTLCFKRKLYKTHWRSKRLSCRGGYVQSYEAMQTRLNKSNANLSKVFIIGREYRFYGCGVLVS